MSEEQDMYAPGQSITEAVMYVILDGCVIEKNGVSICDLRKLMDEYRYEKAPMIQVDYKDFSEIYSSPKLAVRKFAELVYVR